MEVLMLIYETDTEYILQHENIRIVAEKKNCPKDYVTYLQGELEKVLSQPRLDFGSIEKSAIQEPRLTEYSKWQLIREKRNRLLAESDWTQMADVPMEEDKRAAWRRYRQALRDLPEQYSQADEVVWPTKPS